MEGWNLGKEIEKALRQWYLFLLLAALGAGIGWGLAQALPVPWQASTELYIGLNAYRAYADPSFSALANPEYSNEDDYKNWQMAQLNELVLTPEYVNATLEALAEVDPAWMQISAAELRASLHAEWRTAGRWRLVAERPEADRAVEAVTAWKRVVLASGNEAIQAATQMLKLDLKLQAAADENQRTRARLDLIRSLQTALAAESTALADHPELTEVEGMQRTRILRLGGQAAEFTPAWLDILAKQPALRAAPQVYQDWIALVLSQLDAEAPLLEAHLLQLTAEEDPLLAEYDAAVKASRGLSPNLEISDADSAPAPVPQRARPVGIFALAGGMLGAIAFLLWQALRIQRSRTAE